MSQVFLNMGRTEHLSTH